MVIAFELGTCLENSNELLVSLELKKNVLSNII